MSKRLYTADTVLEAVLADEDDDQDYDDPLEPIMEGSDDEFFDLELDEEDYQVHVTSPDSPAPSSSNVLPPSPHSPAPSSSNVSPPSPHSPAPSSSPSNASQSSPQPETWTSTLKPVEVKPFNSPVGPTQAVPESPREVFELFFSDNLIQLIVTESNRYAEEVMGSQKFAQWTKLTVDEVKAFLGFSILMGINQLPAVKDYWKKSEYLHYSPVADGIPRDLKVHPLRRQLHSPTAWLSRS